MLSVNKKVYFRGEEQSRVWTSDNEESVKRGSQSIVSASLSSSLLLLVDVNDGIQESKSHSFL